MIDTSGLVPTGTSRIPNWISGGSYVIGDQVVSTVNLLGYIRKTNGAGATDPSSDTTNWQPFGFGIKSLQRGTSSLSGVGFLNVAVTSVATSKSKLELLGVQYGGTVLSEYAVNIKLTSSTQITIDRGSSSAATCNVSWELVEYY